MLKYFIRQKDVKKLAFISFCLNKYYSNETIRFFSKALQEERYEDNEQLKNIYQIRDLSKIDFEEIHMDISQEPNELIRKSFERLGLNTKSKCDLFFNKTWEEYQYIMNTSF